MRIRFIVIYKHYVIFFSSSVSWLAFFWCKRKAKQCFDLAHYEAETTPLVLSCMCNKRLLSPTARHAGKRPSEQFAVSFLPTIYLKKKRVNFTQERVLLSLN